MHFENVMIIYNVLIIIPSEFKQYTYKMILQLTMYTQTCYTIYIIK